jgi:hypothetical protein
LSDLTNHVEHFVKLAETNYQAGMKWYRGDVMEEKRPAALKSYPDKSPSHKVHAFTTIDITDNTTQE